MLTLSNKLLFIFTFKFKYTLPRTKRIRREKKNAPHQGKELVIRSRSIRFEHVPFDEMLRAIESYDIISLRSLLRSFVDLNFQFRRFEIEDIFRTSSITLNLPFRTIKN